MRFESTGDGTAGGVEAPWSNLMIYLFILKRSDHPGLWLRVFNGVTSKTMWPVKLFLITLPFKMTVIPSAVSCGPQLVEILNQVFITGIPFPVCNWLYFFVFMMFIFFYEPFTG